MKILKMKRESENVNHREEARFAIIYGFDDPFFLKNSLI